MTDNTDQQLEVYERACLAYARDARAMRAHECDRHAMVGAFLTIRHALIELVRDEMEGRLAKAKKPAKRTK